jgi:hypothetical protein
MSDEDVLMFKVLVGPWYAAGEEYSDDGTGESIRVDDPSPELVRLAAGAHGAGVIKVTRGLDASHVQSQEDGERALAAAMESGAWHVGNAIQQAENFQAALDLKLEEHANAVDAGDEQAAGDLQAEVDYYERALAQNEDYLAAARARLGEEE